MDNLLFSYYHIDDKKLTDEGHTFIGTGKDPNNGLDIHVFLKKECSIPGMIWDENRLSPGTEVKFKILTQLDPNISLAANIYNEWYVSSNMEVSEGNGLLVHEYGVGKTKEEAIKDHFRIYCLDLPAHKHVYVRGTRFRWSRIDCKWICENL